MVVPAYSLVAPPPPLPGEQMGVKVLLRQLISSGSESIHIPSPEAGDGVFFVWPIGTWGQPVLSHGHCFYVLASGLVV